MTPLNRRNFLKSSTATGLAISAPLVKSGWAKNSPNESVNVAVIGLHGRGSAHYKSYINIPNTRVAAVCDVDENQFLSAVDAVAQVSGTEPKTIVDFRELLDNKDIDAVSIATPDHWHALQAVWAMQAGKDVYVEKPISYTIRESRAIVDATRKYNRIVQVGTQMGSDPVVAKAFEYMRSGLLGDIYMGKVVVYDHRPSIGHKPDGPAPEGVHWDLFLGPAPLKPFNENRFLYNWHWQWDTTTTEFGNAGAHYIDIVRLALQKNEHPVTAQCVGGLYGDDSDREVPNVQVGQVVYADDTIMQLEVRNTYSNQEGEGRDRCSFLYGTKGYMYLNPGVFSTYLGPARDPGPAMTQKDLTAEERSNAQQGHFGNFIDCVRSRRQEDVNAPVEGGHLSTAIAHIGNIAYRTGRKLQFDPKTERFVNDEDANKYLTRKYRAPYMMPEQI